MARASIVHIAARQATEAADQARGAHLADHGAGFLGADRGGPQAHVPVQFRRQCHPRSASPSGRPAGRAGSRASVPAVASCSMRLTRMPSSRAAGAPRPALSTSRTAARASSALSRTPTSTPPMSVLCRMSREQILATTGHGTACYAGHRACTSAIGAIGTPSSPNAAAASNSDRSPRVGKPAGHATGSGGVPAASGVRPTRNRQASASAQDSGRAERRHAGFLQQRQRLPGLRGQERQQRLALHCRGLDDRPHRVRRVELRRRARHAQHRIAPVALQHLLYEVAVLCRRGGQRQGPQSAVWRIFRPRPAMCSMNAVGGATASTSAGPSRSGDRGRAAARGGDHGDARVAINAGMAAAAGGATAGRPRTASPASPRALHRACAGRHRRRHRAGQRPGVGLRQRLALRGGRPSSADQHRLAGGAGAAQGRAQHGGVADGLREQQDHLGGAVIDHQVDQFAHADTFA